MSKKIEWDVYVKWTLGLAIILFCCYIVLCDISFMLFKKETYIEKVVLNLEKREISFEYYNQEKEKQVAFKNYKFKETDSKYIEGSTLIKIYYNPYFTEDIYFAPEKSPSLGSLLLICFGIFVIIILMRR